ncbi:porin [Paraburkholderia acidisoli]|uniref:Porin n=1 Tax=Paraburkholderia acidisoli TaxID=2571748 RepID=A0A7Z2JIY1_9BURK|nr:porin [Paraburkholderia acidisoli]QGZ65633.1 porin [Paraburkholderia acidisoli]
MSRRFLSRPPSPRRRLAAACLSACVALGAGAAHAQSAVTLYGIVDAGIGYVSNVGGKTQVLATNSIMQANRLGFRGSEDLGGGTKAIFTLENGYSTTTGALGQGGKLFGRQAFVGLKDDRYGTLTLGNQYDFMGLTLGMYETSTWLLGQYSDHPFANDRANSLRLTNSVQYLTPVWSGFQFGAMYGFSNLPGDINGDGRAYSFSATYAAGPLNVAAAYTEVAGTSSVLDISTLFGRPAGTVQIGGSYLRTFGVATSYRFAKTFVYAMYTQALYAGVRGQNVQNALFRNGELGLTYSLTPYVTAGAGYTLTTLGSTKLHQVSTTLDYAFSKRTDVYAMFLAEHAQGNSVHASIIGIGGSSSPNQLVADIGIRHKF